MPYENENGLLILGILQKKVRRKQKEFICCWSFYAVQYGQLRGGYEFTKSNQINNRPFFVFVESEQMNKYGWQ